ncbi:MAG: sulfotransferase [Planctomycetes bacterium]|nr:sulfotransferase [Planctomycetota bacterium]
MSCWMSDFRYLIWASEKQALAGYIQCYLKLMDHWRRVLPVPVLAIDYETMVAEPEETARRLIVWCGLEWEPACLEFHARRQPVRTVSAAQVRKPIYQKSVERWRHYAEVLRDLFDLLPETLPPTPGASTAAGAAADQPAGS